MMQPVCPLCRTSKHMHKAKLLYSVPVCKKCFYKFANRRQLAYLVDWAAFNGLAFFLGMGVAVALLALEVSEPQVDTIITIFAWTVFPLIFFLKDGFAGRSPGKLMCGVHVVHKQTFEPIWFGRSFLRNLPLIIPFMPLVIAFLLQKGYRLGDGWASTKVVWTKYSNHPVFTGKLACENCQYDLTANTTGMCPECGTLIPQGRSHNAAHPPYSAPAATS